MKLTKTVKYNYKLTEETLEKDIDEFIAHARKGDYHMDKMYGNEGLKIIKQYLRILNEKCDILRLLKVFCFAKNPPSAEDGVLIKNDVSSDFSHMLKLFQNHYRIPHKNISRSRNVLLDISFSNLDKF